MKRRILIAGGTGLVGKQLLAELAGLDGIDVHMVLRSQPVSHAAGICQHVGATESWPMIIRELKPDVVISCLGTTMKTAGSQAAFRAVDYDLVVAFAQAAREAGTRQFIAVSSVGASARSSNFYLKTKGEAEDAVRTLDFERVDFLRPGLLTGGKRSENRLGETVAALFSPVTDLLLAGPLSKFRSTSSSKVAQSIVTLALGGGHGRFIHENDSINALSG